MRRLAALFTESREKLDTAKAAMQDALTKDHMMSWHGLGTLAGAQHRHHIIAQYMRPDMEPEKMLANARKLHTYLMDRVLMVARSAASGGEINSTDSFSRALGAAELGAQAVLLEDLRHALEMVDGQ
jgi:hypothetical protein